MQGVHDKWLVDETFAERRPSPTTCFKLSLLVNNDIARYLVWVAHMYLFAQPKQRIGDLFNGKQPPNSFLTGNYGEYKYSKVPREAWEGTSKGIKSEVSGPTLPSTTRRPTATDASKPERERDRSKPLKPLKLFIDRSRLLTT